MTIYEAGYSGEVTSIMLDRLGLYLHTLKEDLDLHYVILLGVSVTLGKPSTTTTTDYSPYSIIGNQRYLSRCRDRNNC